MSRTDKKEIRFDEYGMVSFSASQEDEEYICNGCAEEFKNEVDLESHLFNNKHCEPDDGGE